MTLKAKPAALKAYMRASAAMLAGDITADDLPARKPRRKPTKREAPRQIAIVTHLRRHLPEGSLVFHIPNHRRSENHGHFLRAMGQIAGMPDLLVCVPHPLGQAPTQPGGLWFGLEVKDEGGVVSDRQAYWHGVLAALGCPCAVVTDVRGAVVFLEGWGVRFQ